MTWSGVVARATWRMDRRARALVGGAVWLIALPFILAIASDAGWVRALLLLAALVLVPMALDLAVSGAPGSPDRIERVIIVGLLPAAVLLGAALLLPQGPPAAFLALPWLLVTGLIALRGLLRLSARGLGSLDEVCLDAGFIYLAVGGAWTVADRLGFRPLEFASVIVLLTAIHFHFAGFILPVMTGLAMRRTNGQAGRLAAAGVLGGVPLVAVGITASQLGLGPLPETVAAWWLALGGGLTAWLHLRLAARTHWGPAVRVLWAVAAVSLLVSMALAALYGSRFYAPLAWLDIPWMRATHGTANAIGFGVGGLLAWSLALRPGAEDSGR